MLRPLGIAWLRDGGKWRSAVKPWPEELDEWTHFLHDASGNPVSRDAEVGPPGGLRWTAGPLWGRSHEFNNSMCAMVTSRGRLFYIFDYGVTGLEDRRLPEKWTLVARDAFNGARLWQRPLPTWGIAAWRNAGASRSGIEPSRASTPVANSMQRVSLPSMLVAMAKAGTPASSAVTTATQGGAPHAAILADLFLGHYHLGV